MQDVKSKSYTLYDDRGAWLGQVVLTDDGMFASVTDWGNFSYAWRAYGDNFRAFLLQITPDYFGQKMYQGFSYIVATKAVRAGAKTFAEKILPALQKVLKEEQDVQEAQAGALKAALNNPDVMVKVGDALG